jgi:hypothetical protein
MIVIHPPPRGSAKSGAGHLIIRQDLAMASLPTVLPNSDEMTDSDGTKTAPQTVRPRHPRGQRIALRGRMDSITAKHRSASLVHNPVPARACPVGVEAATIFLSRFFVRGEPR